MDILLINPEIPEAGNNFYGAIQESITDMIPLGLLYMATVLKNNGYDVEILDLNTIKDSSKRDEELECFLLKSPGIIGISVMTPCYFRAIKIARECREKMNNNCLIVMGGVHVTFLPDEPLLKRHADIIVRGEGEWAMLQIADFHFRKKNALEIEKIEGISYIIEDRILHNKPDLIRVNDLNTLPVPDRSLLKLTDYRNPGTLISSRGCVAKCNFCAAGAMGMIALRDVESVVGEIISLYNDYDIKYLFFVDNTFTINKTRAREIFRRLKENHVDVYSKMEARVSQVDEEFIKILAEGGVSLIQFGVETGNEKILKTLKKKITLQQVEHAINLCLKYKLNITTYFIIGHPDDTANTIRDTINFAKNLRKKGVNTELGILTPFPGTEIFNRHRELGIEILDWNYENWDLSTPVYKTRNLSARDLARLYKEGLSVINSIG